MLSNLVSKVYGNWIHPVVTNSFRYFKSFWIVSPFIILVLLQYVYTGPKNVYRNWISPAFTYIFHRVKNGRSEEKGTETEKEPTEQNTKRNNKNEIQKNDSMDNDNTTKRKEENTTLDKTTKSSEEKAKEIEPLRQNDKCTNENEIQKKDNTKKKKKKKTTLNKTTKLDNDSILPKVPKGFPNLGNTCYMNAILQNLVWTPSIDQSLSKNKHDNAETALLNLVKESQNGCGDKVNQNILSAVLNAARKHNNQFCGYHQQDSFEMYNTLVGGIQDEKLSCEPEIENSQVSDLEHIMKICPLTRLFGGVFMTVFQYQSCGHVELNFQMFTSICVPVPKEETHTESKPQVQKVEVQEGILVDLNTEEQSEVKNELKMSSDVIVKDVTISDKTYQTDLADFTFSPERKEDKLPLEPLQEANTEKPLTGIEHGLTELTGIEEFDEEIFSCTECTSKDPERYAFGKTLKKLFVITPPPVLVLQINRFMQERRGLRKINKKVSFPEILNFSTYCSAAYKAYEVTEQCAKNTNTAILYDLYGVVAHSGSLSGGHYVAYVKTAKKHPEQLSGQFLKNGGFKDPERIQNTILEFFKKENKAEEVHNQADRESVPSTGIQTEEVHNKDKSAWYYISDSWFNEINKQDVLAISNAYILFYERVQ